MWSALQIGPRPREDRVKVLVPCRMKVSGTWADACIHNASSRGLLVAADDAPKTGSYVDIRRGALVIIGRVVWAKGRFFGVRTQDRISVPALVGEPRRSAATSSASNADVERRTLSRLAAEGRVARDLQRNRQLSSWMQFGFLAFATAAMAVIIADEVGSVLSTPLTTITAALDGRGTR